MKRFLVKTTLIATVNNPRFAGTLTTHYTGKDGKLVKTKTLINKGGYDIDFDWMDEYIEEYGFKRECDAKRSWNYNNPQNDANWTATAEVVCFEVN